MPLVDNAPRAIPIEDIDRQEQRAREELKRSMGLDQEVQKVGTHEPLDLGLYIDGLDVGKSCSLENKLAKPSPIRGRSGGNLRPSPASGLGCHGGAPHLLSWTTHPQWQIDAHGQSTWHVALDPGAGQERPRTIPRRRYRRADKYGNDGKTWWPTVEISIQRTRQARGYVVKEGDLTKNPSLSGYDEIKRMTVVKRD